jgi:hypothetical protein
MSENSNRFINSWKGHLEKIEKNLVSLQHDRLSNILQTCFLTPRPVTSGNTDNVNGIAGGNLNSSLGILEEWDSEAVHVENTKIHSQAMNILVCIQDILRELSMLKCLILLGDAQ